MGVYTTFYSEFSFDAEDECDIEQILLWVNNQINFPWSIKRSVDGFVVKACREKIDEKTILKELLRLAKIMVINGFFCTDSVPFIVSWGDYASGIVHLSALELEEVKMSVYMIEKNGTRIEYILE